MEPKAILNDKTDEEIVIEIKNGDTEKFGILISRYVEKLKRYARKFMQDRVDIEDLVQDVFIKSFQNIQSFDESRKFSPWIYRIAHNEFVNQIRKKITQKILPIDFDTFFPHPEAFEKADTDTEAFFTEKILEEYLNKLDPKYREVLVLYFYEEMDYKQIGEVLAIPVSTVGVRIIRAKEKLKVLIKDKSL
ncbi:MAG: RNA polymerase sigma factor [Candidatus Paceibacterota bacterium]